MNDENLRHDPAHCRTAALKKHANAKPTPIAQILAIQANLYRIAIDSSLPPKDCAQAALAWERLEERKRILRGRPMPGSLRPTGEKAKKSKPTVIEPT